mmetsp:Transcript_26865/g.40102  ORF Transcript_26865/g.40102 Transcript_26865/m.40102 type:complete len:94 (-) Transcript_26865:1400-1681(-)
MNSMQKRISQFPEIPSAVIFSTGAALWRGWKGTIIVPSVAESIANEHWATCLQSAIWLSSLLLLGTFFVVDHYAFAHVLLQAYIYLCKYKFNH